MQRRAELRSAKENGSTAYRVNVHLASLDSILFAEQEHRLPARHHRHDGVLETDAEAALLNQARSGDRDAFSSLIGGHLETLYRLVLRITRNHEDAEDAVQDAILKAHTNLSKFQGRARFSTWISRIAINEALMKRRKHGRRKHVPLEDLTPAEEFNACSGELELRQEDPEALYARLEVREMMFRAASSLLPIYQAVFFLVRVRGCTNQETADELELPVATVKARLHRACKQLREKLTPICEALPC